MDKHVKKSYPWVYDDLLTIGLYNAFTKLVWFLLTNKSGFGDYLGAEEAIVSPKY